MFGQPAASSSPSPFSFNFASSAAQAAPAAPTSAFGFGSAPAASSASAFSFNAASSSAFGAPSSAPAFGAIVPAASQPAFQWGAASAPAATPGSAPTSLFGAAPAAAATPNALGNGAQMGSCLVTKDNKPITHATQWDDLAPQAQQQLLLLEAEIGKAAMYCDQLEECARLKQPQPQQQALHEEGQGLQAQLQGLQGRIQADTLVVVGLRDLVSELLHFTDVAVNVFKRDQQWREVVKAGGGQPIPMTVLEALNSPVVLPSLFLRHMVNGLTDTVDQFARAAAELQASLHTRSFHGAAVGNSPAERLASSVHNMHDAFVATAAMVEALAGRIAQLRDAYLVKQRKAGVYDDPFELADRQYRQQQSAAALDGNDTTTGAGMQVHPALQAPPTATQTPGAPGSTTVSPAVSPGTFGAQGLFGGATTTTTQQQQQPFALSAGSTLSRSTSRVRAKTGRK